MTVASPPPPAKRSAFLTSVVIRVGLPLFLWSLLAQYLDQYLVDAIQNEMASEEGAGFLLWIYGGLSMFISVIAPLVSALLVFYAVRSRAGESVFQYFGRHLSWLIKEQLRAVGKMISWGLLLILPGLWKFLEYSMLSFVVLFDPRYPKGEIDALQTARQFFYRHWGKILAISAAFAICTLILTSVDEYRSFQDHPASAVLMVFVDLVLFILFQWSLLRIWEKSHAHV